jgi:hypothetical protein
MRGLGSVRRTALAAAFATRSFVAQAGLSVEDHEEKLEIERPMAKSKLLALCLAASGCIMACMWGNFRRRPRLSVIQGNQSLLARGDFEKGVR